MSASAVEAAPKEPPPTNEPLLDLPIAGLTVGKNIREPDAEKMKELARSIGEVGVLEPVLVARRPGGVLDLVAGFRRVAAAKKAGLLTVPARVLDVTELELLEIRLTENLQREDMSELEEAKAFRDYLSAGHTQVQLAKRIGKSQPYVANRIRLLDLPVPVISSLVEGKLSPSHAEVFLQLPKEATPTEVGDLLGRAVRDGESVRQLAERVRWKAGTIRDRVKLKKSREAAIEISKFPICPVKGCGGKGQPDIDWNGKVGPTFSDRRGHTWSRKNGELLKTHSRSDVRRAAEPPKPTLPLVDPNVPCPLTPDELWLTFYTDSTLGIERFSVRPYGGSLDVDLAVRSKRAFPKGLPGFRLGGKPGSVVMDGANEYAQHSDGERKQLAEKRRTLEAWLAGLAGKKKAKP